MMKKVLVIGAFSLVILMRTFGQSTDPIVVDSAGNVAITGSSAITITAPNLIINEVEYSVIPEGAIIMWSGNKVPDGWALCDGTPPTPDLRQQFIAGYDNRANYQEYNQIGDHGGLSSVTLSTSQMPNHSHVINDPRHRHTFAGDNDLAWVNDYAGPAGAYDARSTNELPGQTYYTKDAATGISMNPEGGSQPHENRPPFYVLAYIMKIKTRGTNTVLTH